MNCCPLCAPIQVCVEITDGHSRYKLTVLEGEIVSEIDDDAPGVFLSAGRNAAAMVIREIEGGAQ